MRTAPAALYFIRYLQWKHSAPLQNLLAAPDDPVATAQACHSVCFAKCCSGHGVAAAKMDNQTICRRAAMPLQNIRYEPGQICSGALYIKSANCFSLCWWNSCRQQNLQRRAMFALQIAYKIQRRWGSLHKDYVAQGDLKTFKNISGYSTIYPLFNDTTYSPS